jgi:hypothetical protein
LQAPRGKDLAGDAVWRHVWRKMTDTHETKLVEALRKVDVHGDVAPAHVQDPMTMVLRQTAIQADLMRWDDNRGHYVLTGTGRIRINSRNRAPGSVLRFRKREELAENAAPRQSKAD